jgi:hypothetical protein
MMRRLVVLSAVFALAIPSFAGKDRQFNALVKAIETQYGLRHVRIPLVGFATFCLRMTGTPGTAGLKIAVFDDLRDRSAVSTDSFEQSVQAAMGSGWHPLVRARSRADGQVTLVYTNPDPKDLEVLIVWVGGDEATVVETKLKSSELWNWINHPQDTVDHEGDGSMHARLSISADDH